MNHQGVRKESSLYANGTRRESTTFPNGVVKETIIHPDGETLQKIYYGKSSIGDNESKDIKGEQHEMGSKSFPDRPRARSTPRSSIANFVAPPLTNITTADPIPKCCCCIDIRVAAILIGLIELIGLAFVLYITIDWYVETSNDPGVDRQASGRRPTFLSRHGILGGTIFSVAVFLLAIITLVYGVWKKNVSYMMLHLVVQMFSILGALAGLVIASIVMAYLKPTNEDGDLSDKTSKETYYSCVAILVFCILAFILEIYFFFVIRKCARFFTFQESAESDAA